MEARERESARGTQYTDATNCGEWLGERGGQRRSRCYPQWFLVTPGGSNAKEFLDLRDAVRVVSSSWVRGAVSVKCGGKKHHPINIRHEFEKNCNTVVSMRLSDSPPQNPRPPGKMAPGSGRLKKKRKKNVR